MENEIKDLNSNKTNRFKRLMTLIKYYKFNTLYVLLRKIGFKVESTLFKVKTEVGTFWLSNERNEAKTFDEVTEYDKYYQPMEYDIILDLGVCLGISSIYFANKYGCKVIGVEPVPYCLDRITKNINENKKCDITIVKKAVTGKEMSNLNVYSPLTSWGNGSCYEMDSPNTKTIAQTITLKELIKKYKPTIMKCDIEGGEYMFLDVDDETKNLIKDNLNFVVFEVHSVAGHTGHEMVSLFNSLGFKTKLDGEILHAINKI